MTPSAIIVFFRSFSWKEWIVFSVVVAWHTIGGWLNGGWGLATIGLALGTCVGGVLVLAWRILDKIDARKRKSD